MKATISFTFVFVHAMLFALAGAVGPSPVSSAFTCPTSDTFGFPVGVIDTSSDSIMCTYPPDISNTGRTEFYCTYSKTTGTRVTDNNVGGCPTAALTVFQRRAYPPRAPLPTRPPVVRGVRASPTDKTFFKKRPVSSSAV